jgi:hypothetical protein
MALEWIVEVRLINPNGDVVGTWQKALDQLSANELYQELMAQLRKKYPNARP